MRAETLNQNRKAVGCETKTTSWKMLKQNLVELQSQVVCWFIAASEPLHCQLSIVNIKISINAGLMWYLTSWNSIMLETKLGNYSCPIRKQLSKYFSRLALTMVHFCLKCMTANDQSAAVSTSQSSNNIWVNAGVAGCVFSLQCSDWGHLYI